MGHKLHKVGHKLNAVGHKPHEAGLLGNEVSLKYVHVENAHGKSGITSVSSTAGNQNEVLRTPVRTVLT